MLEIQSLHPDLRRSLLCSPTIVPPRTAGDTDFLIILASHVSGCGHRYNDLVIHCLINAVSQCKVLFRLGHPVSVL